MPPKMILHHDLHSTAATLLIIAKWYNNITDLLQQLSESSCQQDRVQIGSLLDQEMAINGVNTTKDPYQG